MRARRWLGVAAVATAGIAVGGAGAANARVDAPAANPAAAAPPIKHLFIINIENKGYAKTWGPTSKAPYLARTLRSKGVLLSDYYGTAHNSQPNYIAQISGQGPNRKMQYGCVVYSPFKVTGTAAYGQYVGSGCVFPAQVKHLPGQLQAKGLRWKGYMQDMGTPCRHPAIGAKDDTQHAEVGDQYAARHNPFVYFRSIIDSPSCEKNVVDLSRLTTDLRSVATTPNYVYISPDLCNDGHDIPCVDGRAGGLPQIDKWMKAWVPKILDSPAFKQDGALVITADEAETRDSTACCGEGPAPNAPLPGIDGLGGGRIGALVISRFARPGTATTRDYNHYSLLASTQDIFTVPYLGYAAKPALPRFGRDVWNAAW
ncbi:MAG: alkaline phosphatase family protein [Tetrasphaera sp.]